MKSKTLIRRRLRHSSAKGVASLSAIAGFYGSVPAGSPATDGMRIRDDWRKTGGYIYCAYRKASAK